MANNPQYPGFQPFQNLNVGTLDQARGFAPSMNFQFRPTIPALQSEQVALLNSQNFQCVGRGGTMMNLGFPSHSYVPQSLQSMHHTFERPSQSNQVQPVPLGPPTLISQPNISLASGTSLPRPSRPYVQTPDISMSGFGGPRALYPHASSYEGLRAPTQVTGPNSLVQTQQRASMSQTIALPSMVNPTFEQSKGVSFQPMLSGEIQTDWVEHTSADGRRYFFNKRSKQSTWEKPLELMTPFERADARTDWKEHSSADGRKYYYNKVTKQSTWSIPEELKIAREQAEKASGQGPHAGAIADASKVLSRSDSASTAAPTGLPSQTSSTPSTSDACEKLVLTADSEAASVPGSYSPVENVERVQMIADKTPQLRDTAENADLSATETKTSVATLVDMDKISAENSGASDEVSAKNTNQGSGTGLNEIHSMGSGRIGTQLEEKRINQEHVPYNNKLEAVEAFKSLLKSANVGADWTWEQALREIINDKRYGALRTLGERKQAFNEFLVQMKREEEEERLAKQKKRYEDFKKMLEECMYLTPSTRWSKALTMFEDDERFKALDREKDRRNIFEDHVSELKEKLWVKAIEERKQNITEYRRFLESCKFIKSNSQWRKVQNRLEVDERCSRLEKIDQIEIFQEYLRDLEREEEERKKIQKEELKKAERKNRDDFRGLIDEHIATGVLTAKTSWRDYLEKVRDLPVYSAIASNSSGATPKDLFEDTVEELQKQHRELKSQVKDVLKLKKVTLSAGSTFEEFKVSISEDVSFPPIPDVKLKLVFDDLLERAKDKEEKEARKRTRHTEKLVDILRSFKDITSTSSWEESKHLVESSEKCRTMGDESFRRQTFEDYVSHLKEQSKRIKQNKAEKVTENTREEREKGKGKYRREDRVRERDSEDPHKKAAANNYNHDFTETHGQERRRSGRDSHSRHRERHTNLKENETDYFKEPLKTGGGQKKSRQQRGSMSEAEDEGREKRRRKEEESEQTKGEAEEDEELEDGECGRY